MTGGARGIGRAVATRLVAEGAKVAIVDLDGEAAAEAAAALGGAAGIASDVRDSGSVKVAFSAAREELGGLDILVNNAGVARDGRLGEMTDEDWNLVLDVSLRGAFFCCRAALPWLIEAGRSSIVNMSSRAYLGNPGQANYSAAKAGLIGLTRALSLELGRHGVRVNAIAPGMIDTDLVRSHPKAEQMVERAVRATPLGRIGEPEDVAAAVAYLASDDASYVSGDVVHVAGGRW